MSEQRKKTNFMIQSGIKGKAILICLFVYVLQLSFMASKIGMQGMNYYFVSISLFLALFSLLGAAMPVVMKKQINFQVCRGGFKNARKIYKVTVSFHMIMTALVSGALFLFSDTVSRFLFSSVLYSLNLKVLAGVLVLLVARKAMAGYLEGVNNVLPGVVATYISFIISCITTVLVQNSCISYGSSLAAFMRQEEYYYAYASLSGIAGFAVGNLFAFLFQLLIIWLFRSVQSEKVKRDNTRSVLSFFDVLVLFYKNYIPELLTKLVFPLLTLLLIFQYYKTSSADSHGMGTVSMGIYLFLLLPVSVAFLIGTPLIRHLTGILKKQDKHHARERIALNFKLLTYYLFPYLALVLCMANPLSQMLFDSADDAIMHMMRIGCWVVFFCTVSVFLFCVLSAVCGKGLLGLIMLLAAATGCFAFTLFSSGSGSPADAFAYSLLVASLLTVLIFSALLFKKLRFVEDLIRIFLLPLVAAVVVGICAFLFSLLMEGQLAFLIVLIILLVSYFVYHLVLLLTHTFDRHEFGEIPANKLIVSIAKKLNMF